MGFRKQRSCFWICMSSIKQSPGTSAQGPTRAKKQLRNRRARQVARRRPDFPARPHSARQRPGGRQTFQQVPAGFQHPPSISIREFQLSPASCFPQTLSSCFAHNPELGSAGDTVLTKMAFLGHPVQWEGKLVPASGNARWAGLGQRSRAGCGSPELALDPV